LVYSSGAPQLNQLAWYSRDGHSLGPVGAPGNYQQIFLSPNEKLAAVNVDRDGLLSLGLLRLDNHILTLVASETQARITDGSWSPDSSQLVYETQTPTQSRIMTISLSDATPKLLYEDGVRNYADDWSPDGKWIIYRREGRAVYIVTPDGKTKPQLLLDAPYAVDQFQFSPDTQWLAYNSLKSGQWEVYVSRFPSMRDTRQVSTAGGCQPIWSRDGKELFYLADDARLMSVPITGGSNLKADTPKELFPTSMRRGMCSTSQYAATRNGDKFLMIEPAHTADVPASREPIHILINWTTALRH
jgi:Tol biopolymer transport system component